MKKKPERKAVWKASVERSIWPKMWRAFVSQGADPKDEANQIEVWGQSRAIARRRATAIRDLLNKEGM